jgi:AraC family transcriptional activator of mtrCDE
MGSSAMNGQPVSLDALSGLAPLLRVRPELSHVCRFGDQWASSHPPARDSWAPFHIVTEGNCILHLTATGRSVALQKGDVAVLPHGSPHVVHSPNTSYDAPGPFGIRHRSMRDIPVQTNTDAQPETQLVCGRLKFDLADQNLVLSALPDSIVVSAANDRSAPHIQRLIALVREELETGRPGAAAIA